MKAIILGIWTELLRYEQFLIAKVLIFQPTMDLTIH